MTVPEHPKIYYIMHVNQLESIVRERCIWSHSEVVERKLAVTNIGIEHLKQRRSELPLQSHDGLYVGMCVPFYFCPRSVMLYMLHKGNDPELGYKDGQEPIIHLSADLHAVVEWAQQNHRRWAFTASNAGSLYFEDYADLDRLDKINWDAVKALAWKGDKKEGKQAEFLIERNLAWTLVERIGVRSQASYRKAKAAIDDLEHRPSVKIQPDWYY